MSRRDTSKQMAEKVPENENKAEKGSKRATRSTESSDSKVISTQNKAKTSKRKQAEEHSKKQQGHSKRAVDKNTVEYYKALLYASRQSDVPLSSFKKLKYSYPSVGRSQNDALHEPRSPKKLLTSPENTGFYNGRPIDISSKFENGAFLCYNTHSCISCLDCSDRFVVVGLKESCEPFNIFEAREGPSEILVLDSSLNAVDRMAFSFGGVTDLKMRDELLFVLFRNGNLVKIEDLDQDKLTLINPATKATRFDANNTVQVYTNGNELYNSLGQSKTYDGVVVDLAISEHSVFILDVNGKIVQSALDFTDPKELACKYTFNKIAFFDGLLVAFEDDVKSHTVFFPDTPDGMHDSFVSYFLGLFDGTISNFKRYKGKKRCRQIFQVLKREDGTVFCASEHEFVPGERLFIPAVRPFDDSFVFATENGLVIRVFYE